MKVFDDFLNTKQSFMLTLSQNGCVSEFLCVQAHIKPLLSRIPPLLPFPFSLHHTNLIFYFLYPKYISQIKSDLHKTVRETFCGFPMMDKKQPTP